MHVEDLIVALIKYDLIFGITWFDEINSVIDCGKTTMTFPRLPMPNLTSDTRNKTL
jgi:hypothetical protein